MSKVWVFFKLRLLQLRYDKTALFFSYFLPIVLLMGIGYPIELANNKTISLYYDDQVNSDKTKKFLDYLEGHELIGLIQYKGKVEDFAANTTNSKLKHLLQILPVVESDAQNEYSSSDIESSIVFDARVELLSGKNIDEKIQRYALSEIINNFKRSNKSFIHTKTLPFSSGYSYLSILLPGLIGMTLLTIGLNGFGGVLVSESFAGLFNNIKTINASPIPFLTGLFLTRLLISYTVAAALYLVGVLMFELATEVDYFLLFLIISLGCVSFLGLGLVIAVLSPSANAFSGIVSFVQIPFVLFSGVFFSTTAFPDWLQLGTQFIPLTHLNTAMKAILFDDVSLFEISKISKEIMVMSLWCVATVVLGWKKFKW
ncbi:ABC transporter permease [Aliikangiella sp. IMCC44359]|uniref:ABC transporter permease n=1 Tax=Aliikangiella sp. IMCC44359 TaxID=3459125 RepID=UPI00403AE73D